MRPLISLYLSLLFLSLFQNALSAQKQNYIWYFGNKAGLDFNSSPPKAISSELVTLEGTASISDPAGHLLFYTNGDTVWDRTHNVMPNGTGLMGGTSSTQAALIVPIPNSCDQYYVFTTEDHETNGGLAYSRVDMCLHDHNGDVVTTEKNILLQDGTAEKVTAILHENGTDIWIISHKLSSNEFMAYLVTAAGINTSPVISAVGSTYPFNGHIGPAKASHDGTKIASAASFRNICELFDFDKSTGLLSNPVDLMQLLPQQSFIYGLEFSPNDSLLYLTSFFVTSRLFQLEISTMSLTALSSKTGNYVYGMLQLGTDNKIYMARTDENFIDVIRYPDLVGVACQYEEAGQTLVPGSVSQTGLPNFAPYSFYLENANPVTLPADTTLCQNTSLELHIDSEAGCVAGLLWNNGSTSETIIANDPGIYWVEVRSSCSSYRDSIEITKEVCTPIGCVTNVGPHFGLPGQVIHGSSLAPTQEKDGFYLGGFLNDSALLIRYDLEGRIVWARTFDVAPGLPDNISTILLDSDGMLAIGGIAGDIPNTQGGPVFVFRYDPVNDNVLWSKLFVPAVTRNFCWTIIEKNPGGNYIISNEPVDDPNSNVNSELFEINRTTGTVAAGIYKNYDLGSSEELSNLQVYNGFLYGVGRFSDGPTPPFFRNTLVKLNLSTGDVEWARLGHRPKNATARLYGADLVIDNNEIYSCFAGDPNGTSFTNTNFYVQKTSLDGNLIWLKQYDFPGTNDWGFEINKTNNGLVILAAQRNSPRGFILFKIDLEGNVLWAQRFNITHPINDQHLLLGANKLIEVGGQFVFTGYETVSPTEANLFVQRCDLNGHPLGLCTEFEPVNISVITVENPVFYAVTPIETTPDFSTQKITTSSNIANIAYDPNCSLSDTIYYTLTDTICAGQSLEGYSQSGVYEDLFTTAAGCDSVRILALTVLDPIVTTLAISICEGESFEGYSVSGTYQDHFVAASGCDSLRTLTLTITECGPDCGNSVGPVYGNTDKNEYGYGLAARPQGDGFYAVGRKADSTLIMQLDLDGNILWSEKFDLSPDTTDHSGTVIVDSDGNLVIGGTGGDAGLGGSTFACKFNPVTRQIIWAKEYITVWTHGRFFYMAENPNNGNYVISTNPEEKNTPDNDATLLEVERNTGNINQANSKQYSLKSSETINKFLYHDGFIYGAGRYTDGALPAQMRNTLVKIDPSNMHHVWVRLGHVPTATTARFYGFDLLIHDEAIYSGYHGDPDGTSTTNTMLYLQKTSLNGDLLWLKQYDLPGNADIGLEVLEMEDGFVVLAQDHSTQRRMFLFKVDYTGNVLWANEYRVDGMAQTDLYYFGRDPLIRVDDQLVFTGYGNLDGYGTEMLIFRTDLNGHIQTPCAHSESITISVQNVNNPVFYSVDIIERDPEFSIISHTPGEFEAQVEPNVECISSDTIYTFLEASICQGDEFEGYTSSGTYEDLFVSVIGCDSLRTLVLHVISCNSLVEYNLDACSSFMSNGSHMDYSEFDPEYPSPASCAIISASELFRDPPQENKHSCTPGVNGSIAMCISALNSCTYVAGHDASLVSEINIVPDADSTLRISKLEFYERSPVNYNWIGGSTGPNNYPRFYGIRILANGVEIYRQTGIGTHADWTLQIYEFPDIPAFNISSPTLLRIEILPYCLIGNGALVAAWDIDEMNLFGGCISNSGSLSGIVGTIKTHSGLPVPGVQVSLGKNFYTTMQVDVTDDEGQYHFPDIKKGAKYYLRGKRNTDLLESVSTLDLIAIQKHLLGIKTFDALPKFIAADVNHSEKITVTDIVDLRKALLGVNDYFPNNTSWRIGNCRTLHSSDMNDFYEREEIPLVVDDLVRMDFLGIKIGDVNGDIHPDAQSTSLESRSEDMFPIFTPDQSYTAGNEIIIPIIANSSIDIEGIQLAFDVSKFDMVRIVGGKIPVQKDNYFITENGQLRLIWSEAQSISIKKNEVVFSLVVVSKTTGKLADQFSLMTNEIKPETYLAGNSNPVMFHTGSSLQQPEHQLTNLRIEPNPFSNEATIRFDLTQPGKVKILLFNVSGQQVYAHDGEYAAGNQSLTLNSQSLPYRESVLYFQVIHDGNVFVEKLIRVR